MYSYEFETVHISRIVRYIVFPAQSVSDQLSHVSYLNTPLSMDFTCLIKTITSRDFNGLDKTMILNAFGFLPILTGICNYMREVI